MSSYLTEEDVEIEVYDEEKDILNQLNTLKEVKIMKLTEVIGYAIVPLDVAKLLLAQRAEKAKYSLHNTTGILGTGMYFSVGNAAYIKKTAISQKQVVIQARINPGKCIDTLSDNSRLIILNTYKKLLEQNKQITATTLYNAVTKQYKEKVQSIRGIGLYGNTIVDCTNQVILHEYQSILLCILDSNCIIDISGAGK